MEKNLLDEALDDFAPTAAEAPALDRGSPVFKASSDTVELGSSSVGDPSTSSPAPQPFDPLGKRQKGKLQAAAGPVFDPLKQGGAGKRTGAKTKGTSSSVNSGQNSTARGKQDSSAQAAGVQPPASSNHTNVDEELARGVAQLMADLAKAAPSAGEDSGKASPHEREIASTLAALAAAAPASGRTSEGPGSQSSAGQRWDLLMTLPRLLHVSLLEPFELHHTNI